MSRSSLETAVLVFAGLSLSAGLLRWHSLPARQEQNLAF